MRITKENLQRYDQNLKWWHQNRLATKNALRSCHLTEESGAVAFYPVGGSALEGKVKFSFKETPPASGDKGPTNPSTITGVTQAKVTRCGKNLLKYPYIETSHAYNSGLVATTEDNAVTVNGSGGSSVVSFSVTDGGMSAGTSASSVRLNSGSTYTVSLTVASGTLTNASDIKLVFIDHENGTVAAAINAGATATVTANFSKFRVRLEFAASATYNNVTVLPQLELGITATSFEPYAGADYTVSLPSTYYGGSIDLSTGLMTVTHKADVITHDGRSGSVLTNTVNLWCYTSSRHIGGSSSVYWACDKFPCLTPSNTDVEHIRPTGSPSTGTQDVGLYINKSRLDVSGAADPSNPTDAEWRAAGNAWLTNNPITFVYQLKTPLTIQLSPVQISALAQTNRFTPRLNTVYTDADSIQISYQKSPIRIATEQEQAILSLGGNI